jgi:two-component SAPR family response regulator
MGTQRITGISEQDFHAKISETQLTLLYPWNPYRNAFLAYVVADSGKEMVYYRLTEDDVTLQAWLTNMGETLVAELGGFSPPEDMDPSAWGEALAQHINAFAERQAVWFFLDEIDRVPHDDNLSQFVIALVESISENVSLVVSSRLLKYQPWYDFVEQRNAAVFGTERRAHDVMFSVSDDAKPPLEVYGLGRGYALVSGQEITNWDGALPRNLFFYFMDNPLVTRDEIFEVFWPRLTTKEATNVFHVTKRKISERITMKIDQTGNYELTQYSAGFYKPSDKLIRYYDVEEFEDAVNDSITAMDEAEQEVLLQRAIDLYKGPFLQDGTMAWMVERRNELRGLYAQALIGMGRICQRRAEHMTALGYYVRALKETPEREDIHRNVMQIYINEGMYDDARNQYKALAKRLNKELKIEPDNETRQLFESIPS